MRDLFTTRHFRSLIVVAACAASQLTFAAPQAEHRWSHTVASGAILETVAIGNHGTLVFSAIDGTSEGRAFLHSSYDVGSGTPIWEAATAGTVLSSRVASALHHDRHALLQMVPSPVGSSQFQAVVRSFSSSSPTPSWSWTFPIHFLIHERAAVHVSSDGAWVLAALYDWDDNSTHVVRFDSVTGAVLAQAHVPTSGGFNHSLLSGDDRVLYLAGSSRSFLIDAVQPDQHTVWMTYMTSPRAHAISHDGSRFFIGGSNAVRGWERFGSSFVETLHLQLDGPTLSPQRLALSRDGSHLIAGFIFSSNARDLRVVAWNLPAAVKVTDHVLLGGGSFNNRISGLAVSADGSRFAMGSWGDQEGLIPHLALYRTGSDAPYAQFHFPGSVVQLQVSTDGDWAALARKSVHSNIPGSGGAVDLFSTRERDVQITGVPRLGLAPIHVSVFTQTTGSVWLLSNTALGTQPLAFDGGTLFLERQGLALHPLVPEGNDWYGMDWIPLETTGHYVGQTLYFQGLSLQQRRLTRAFAALTILP